MSPNEMEEQAEALREDACDDAEAGVALLRATLYEVGAAVCRAVERSDLDRLTDAVRVSLRPGDVLFLTHPRHLPEAAHERMRAVLEPVLQGARVVILEEGMRLSGVAGLESEEAAPAVGSPNLGDGAHQARLDRAAAGKESDARGRVG